MLIHAIFVLDKMTKDNTSENPKKIGFSDVLSTLESNVSEDVFIPFYYITLGVDNYSVAIRIERYHKKI